MITPATAASSKETEIDLINKTSGYKILVPNFIKIGDAQAEVDGEVVTVNNVVFMQTRERCQW